MTDYTPQIGLDDETTRQWHELTRTKTRRPVGAMTRFWSEHVSTSDGTQFTVTHVEPMADYDHEPTFAGRYIAPMVNDPPPGFPDDDNDGPGEDNPPPDLRCEEYERFIPLTQDTRVIVDFADYEWLSAYSWCLVNQKYAGRAIPNDNPAQRQKFIYMHKVILGAGDDVQVDHINGNKLDNRRANLRICTAAQNQLNKAKPSLNKFRQQPTSQYKGVHWRAARRRWEVLIMVDGKQRYIGRFKDEIEAAHAYDAAAHQYHGDFARVNFPDDCPKCACGAPATTLVHCQSTHRLCDVCYENDFNQNEEEIRSWESEPIARAATLQSIAIEGRIFVCKNCQGIHPTQKCPELRSALFADEPAIAVYETREMVRLWGVSRTLLVAKLRKLTRPQLVCQAVAFAAWLDARTQAGLSAASVLHIWETMLDDGPTAPAMQVAA